MGRTQQYWHGPLKITQNLISAQIYSFKNLGKISVALSSLELGCVVATTIGISASYIAAISLSTLR